MVWHHKSGIAEREVCRWQSKKPVLSKSQFKEHMLGWTKYESGIHKAWCLVYLGRIQDNCSAAAAYRTEEHRGPTWVRLRRILCCCGFRLLVGFFRAARLCRCGFPEWVTKRFWLRAERVCREEGVLGLTALNAVILQTLKAKPKPWSSGFRVYRGLGFRGLGFRVYRGLGFRV